MLRQSLLIQVYSWARDYLVATREAGKRLYLNHRNYSSKVVDGGADLTVTIKSCVASVMKTSR